MSKVPEMFGSMVFTDKKMQERLPKSRLYPLYPLVSAYDGRYRGEA